VQKFDGNGTFLTKWGSNGSGDGQFTFPVGVATDTSGNVYVADSSNHRMQKFDGNGTFLAKWGSNGSGDGQFTFLRGVATNSSGNVYVADRSNERIQLFGTASFTLAADRDPVNVGETASLRTFAGEPAKLAILFVTMVNSSPHFLPVVVALLDTNGTLTVSGVVPSGVSGDTITFRSFSFDASNIIIQTNQQALTIN
jgi:sugar lactone lactonase YvrE